MEKILCSACLLGIRCNYKGEGSSNEKVLKLLGEKVLIPVCPEQLGGLPTPREPIELTGDGLKVLTWEARAVTESGADVTAELLRGAEEVLRIAKLFNAKLAIMKRGSPSCGCGEIYDGTFTGSIVRGDGVTTALLKAYGVKVIPEDA